MPAEQFDINKRLIALLQNEIQAEKQMNSLAKQTSKFNDNVVTLRDAIEKQQREAERTLALVKHRGEYLESRKSLNDAVKEQVTAAKEQKKQMQEHLTRAKQEHSQIKGCVRTLCEATNTLISAKELPARLKGVSISCSGDQWQPFDVAASDLKGLSTLWNRVQIPSTNATKWRQLMSPASTQNDNENANISASSIIEIDLTSPLSHN